MITLGEQEHVISTITAGGLHVPIYQARHDFKKTRNRLAQRKHRIRANALTDSRRLHALEDTSTYCMRSALPETTIAQHQSEVPKDQIPYANYQDGETVSPMHFDLPGSPESASFSGQSLESEQQMIPISEVSFDSAGVAFFPENLCPRQDLVVDKIFPSQNYSSLVHEFPQQQPPQYQAQAAQPSEVSRLILQTHHPISSTQLSPMRAEAEVPPSLLQTRHSSSPIPSSPTRAEAEGPGPLVQTPRLFSPTMSPSNTTRKSYNSVVAPNFKPVHRGETQDQTNSNNISHTRSEADVESSLAQSAHSETSDTISNAEDLETRFENLIKAVQEAGFESIDDMSAQYYTAAFKEDTVSYWAQSRSRSRFLHAFLASLHASTNNWSDREIQGYRQQILEAAESFHVSELSDAREDLIQNEERRSQPLNENAPSPVSQTAMSVQSLWQTIAKMELSQDFKQKKTMLREKMPETWSLLVELTRKADLHQPRGSQAVYAFLLLLVETNPGSSPRVSRASDERHPAGRRER